MPIQFQLPESPVEHIVVDECVLRLVPELLPAYDFPIVASGWVHLAPVIDPSMLRISHVFIVLDDSLLAHAFIYPGSEAQIAINNALLKQRSAACGW